MIIDIDREDIESGIVMENELIDLHRPVPV